MNVLLKLLGWCIVAWAVIGVLFLISNALEGGITLGAIFAILIIIIALIALWIGMNDLIRGIITYINHEPKEDKEETEG